MWVTHTHALILHSQWEEFGPQLITAACPLPQLSEEKPTTEDCVLHSLVVWLHPWHLYLWNTDRFLGHYTGLVTGPAGACSVVSWSVLKCVLLSGNNHLLHPSCVLGKHRKDVCVGGMKWSLRQKKLQPSVLNSTRLLPHHIYKTPKRLAPAVLHVCFSLLSAPFSVFSELSTLGFFCHMQQPHLLWHHSVLWSPAEE